ncbi:hypothetical protein HC776_01810 [bacterium]|nr:hypothetical protein [bacterium]
MLTIDRHQTGGIGDANFLSYLALENCFAAGGAWLAPRDVIEAAKQLPAEYQSQINQVFPALIDRQIDLQLISEAGAEQKLAEDPEVKAQIAQITENIIRQAVLDRLLKEKMNDAAIKARYDQFVAALPKQQEVKARHILVDTEEDAKAIIVQLDDDNCDGKVNQSDIPEIVFSTFSGGAYYKQGALHAISVVGGLALLVYTLVQGPRNEEFSQTEAAIVATNNFVATSIQSSQVAQTEQFIAIETANAASPTPSPSETPDFDLTATQVSLTETQQAVNEIATATALALQAPPLSDAERIAFIATQVALANATLQGSGPIGTEVRFATQTQAANEASGNPVIQANQTLAAGSIIGTQVADAQSTLAAGGSFAPESPDTDSLIAIAVADIREHAGSGRGSRHGQRSRHAHRAAG